jgi:hypothetical protein
MRDQPNIKQQRQQFDYAKRFPYCHCPVSMHRNLHDKTHDNQGNVQKIRELLENIFLPDGVQCPICVSHSGVAKDSTFLGRDTVSLC